LPDFTTISSTSARQCRRPASLSDRPASFGTSRSSPRHAG
jgi:hypothetical protein